MNRLSAVLLCFMLSYSVSANAQYIPVRTRWVGPGHPVSKEEYETAHPMPEDVHIRPLANLTMVAKDARPTVLCLIHPLYTETLASSLELWVSDVSREGWNVVSFEYYGGDAESLKTFLEVQWAFTDSLDGVLFVGEMPVAWFEHNEENPYTGEYERTIFPCDLYLSDMNGAWLDVNSNGLIDTVWGSFAPELWLGHILVNEPDSSVRLDKLREYFRRNHEWRTEETMRYGNILGYIDDDWADSWEEYGDYLSETGLIKTNILDGATTVAWDYRDRIEAGYDMMHLSAHSSPWGHFFMIGDEWTGGDFTVYELKETLQKVRFYNLFCCSNASYVEEDYMAGEYVLGYGEGLAAVGSTKSGGMWADSLFYSALGDSAAFGDAFRKWFVASSTGGYIPSISDRISWWWGMTIIGDPTLRLTPAPASIKEEEKISANLSVYPNPFNSHLRIETGRNAEVEIYNIKGERILAGLESSGNGEFIWRPGKALPAGVYLILVRDGKTSSTRRAIYIK